MAERGGLAHLARSGRDISHGHQAVAREDRTVARRSHPTFRAASPGFAKLKGQAEWKLDTPGIGLALAFDYYRFEAFATKDERDARCGPMAHQDVRCVPATTKDLKLNNVSLDSVACGHDIDHPRFDAVVSPLFDAALKRLIRDVVDGPKKTEGRIASTEILIARTRDSISAEAVGQFIKFPVSAMAVSIDAC